MSKTDNGPKCSDCGAPLVKQEGMFYRCPNCFGKWLPKDPKVGVDPEILDAGREMDALVAKKVLGFDVKHFEGQEADGWRYIGKWEVKTIGGIVLPGSHGMDAFWAMNSKPLPPYSTSMAAAWEVLKTIACHRDQAKNIYKPVIRLEYYEHDGIHSVTFGRCKGVGYDSDIFVQVYEEPGPEVPGEGDATDRAMALAICRMALKVVGA